VQLSASFCSTNLVTHLWVSKYYYVSLVVVIVRGGVVVIVAAAAVVVVDTRTKSIKIARLFIHILKCW
jgi:hypothetical protein